MISIIICSRKADIDEALKQNIAQTIGCEYELCVIDNSHNDYNIFTAYNEGVRRAKGDLLLFAHDDVVKYHTQNWGKNVEAHFAEDTRLGLVGVTGTHFWPNCPSEWSCNMVHSGGCIQNVDGEVEVFNDTEFFPPGKTIVEAVAVDGIWFCIRASLFNQIQFDYETFSGWHYYDMDICFQVREVGFKVGIASDIAIEHTSWGTWNNVWMEAANSFYRKWKNTLPQVAGVEMSKREIGIRTTYIHRLMGYVFSYVQCNEELMQVRHSYAYRIGKQLLFPLRKIKQFLNKTK